jgi:hypothetical protein
MSVLDAAYQESLANGSSHTDQAIEDYTAKPCPEVLPDRRGVANRETSHGLAVAVQSTWACLGSGSRPGSTRGPTELPLTATSSARARTSGTRSVSRPGCGVTPPPLTDGTLSTAG